MFGPIADAIARILDVILNLVQVLVIASVIISWVGGDPGNQLVVTVRNLTEPMFKPLRRLTRNLLPGPIDWAPMIVLLIIMFIQYGIIPYLRMEARLGA
jgi:YggT family protein